MILLTVLVLSARGLSACRLIAAIAGASSLCIVGIGEADILATLLEHVEDADLVGRLEVSFLRLYESAVDELHQRIVHRHHSKATRCLKN